MDGIIVINKPKGITSHDVVYKVKKIFNEKVGHTGTLDPNATGVLPLLIGQGTKLSKYLIEHDKIYKVRLTLGKKTDSADVEGNVIEERDVDEKSLNTQNIKNVLNSFIGKSKQIPPMYSAIKVKGKKLYEYARKGQTVDIEPREIEIFEINLINIENLSIDFTVHCSKGTYIRSLCEDIAKKLGTIGYMEELERLKVGNFCINDSITIEELDVNKANSEFFNKHFITFEKHFENINKIILNDKKLSLFLNGVNLLVHLADGIYKVYNNCNFIGIGTVKNNLLKRDIILK